jgi:hypothetical protein
VFTCWQDFWLAPELALFVRPPGLIEQAAVVSRHVND